MNSLAIYVIFALPIVSAFSSWFFHDLAKLRNCIIFSCATVLFIVVLYLAPSAINREYLPIHVLQISSSLAITLNYGPLEIIFAGLTTFLWPVNFFYCLCYLPRSKPERALYTLFSLSIFAYLVTVFSGDLFTLFIGYELLTLTTIPLVAYYGEKKAYKQTALYSAVLLAASLALLVPAIAWTYHITGSATFTPGGIFASPIIELSAIYLMFIIGFAKVGVFPLHFWLPTAMVAPTPVSAFFHAVAVVKAGIFSICKVSLYIFGLDLLQEVPATTIGLYLGIFTMLFASTWAYFQHNLKRKLAYHTIGQQAYMLAGVCMATPEGLVAAVLHALTHAFSKITLFFSVGMIQIIGHRADTHAAYGLGKYAPKLFIVYLIGALSMSGIPPFAGFGSKFFLLLSALDVGTYLLFVSILVCSVLSAGALLPVAYHAFFSEMEISRPGRKPGNAIVSAIITALCCLLLLFCLVPLRDYALNIFEPKVKDDYFTSEIVV